MRLLEEDVLRLITSLLIALTIYQLEGRVVLLTLEMYLTNTIQLSNIWRQIQLSLI